MDSTQAVKRFVDLPAGSKKSSEKFASIPSLAQIHTVCRFFNDTFFALEIIIFFGSSVGSTFLDVLISAPSHHHIVHVLLCQ